MSVGSAITVTGNLFTANGRGIGVVEAGTPTIRGNEFTGQNGAAIFVTDASPIISQNNMHANLWNVQLEGSRWGVTAENNWWGSADVVDIEQSVWDGRDDPLLGLVDFEPYATEAFELDVPEFQ
jgi:hypothetical protein